jgi:hypothetical protein
LPSLDLRLCQFLFVRPNDKASSLDQVLRVVLYSYWIIFQTGETGLVPRQREPVSLLLGVSHKWTGGLQSTGGNTTDQDLRKMHREVGGGFGGDIPGEMEQSCGGHGVGAGVTEASQKPYLESSGKRFHHGC